MYVASCIKIVGSVSTRKKRKISRDAVIKLKILSFNRFMRFIELGFELKIYYLQICCNFTSTAIPEHPFICIYWYRLLSKNKAMHRNSGRQNPYGVARFFLV